MSDYRVSRSQLGLLVEDSFRVLRNCLFYFNGGVKAERHGAKELLIGGAVHCSRFYKVSRLTRLKIGTQ